MALKQTRDGSYLIESEDEAVRALEMMRRIAEEISEIEEQEGIPEMRNDAVELKKAVTEFCISQGFTRLDLPDGHWATLVESTQDRQIVGTREEMDEHTPDRVKPLKEIIGRKRIKQKGKLVSLWNLVTSRRVDVDKVERAVARGWITVDEIAPAYYERQRRPYLRIFGGSDGEG